jgi:nitrous oxidase accessory protein
MMKQNLTIALSMTSVFLFFAFIFTSVSAMNQSSSYVSSLDQDDSILYVGGSGPGNYTRIQDAINNASIGDIIFVYSGFYQENIVIDRPIQLRGEERNTTIIDGGYQRSVIVIAADDARVQNVTVQHAKNDIGSAGIEIQTAARVVVTNNTIQENGWFGVWIHSSGSAQINIESNVIQDNSYGIYLQKTSQSYITGNTVCDNGEGIYILGSSGSQITNNTVMNREIGVHVENCYDMILSENVVINNAHGMYVFNSSEMTLERNTIGWNRWYGLWIKDTIYSSVDENSILRNTDVGLFLESSFDLQVTHNTVWDNDNGIYLKDSAGNIIRYNNLRNFKVNGCFVAHSLVNRRNIWNSNYWERARVFPYPIGGYIKLEKVTLSCINIDWTPLHDPPQMLCVSPLGVQGSILYVGGNGPNNYSSIQAAIDAAVSNDTIYVFNGTYYEAVVLDKPLCLTAENKTTTILEGNGTRDILTILADYVTVDGFTIHNGHFNILVNHSSHGTISNNIIRDGLHGVSIQNDCHYFTITQNSFQDNVYGVRLFYSTDVSIIHNSFQSFKINAFFFGTSLAQGRHHWDQNYWEKPHHLPTIITGKIRLGNFSLIWMNVDWRPLSGPF